MRAVALAAGIALVSFSVLADIPVPNPRLDGTASLSEVHLAELNKDQQARVDEFVIAGRFALPRNALTAREALLSRCLRVFSDNPTAWKRTILGIPYWKPSAWHILGDPQHCKNKTFAADVRWSEKDPSVFFVVPSDVGLFEREVRHLAGEVHIGYDATESDGSALKDEDAKAVKDEAVAFIEKVDASRPFRMFFPVHDNSTSVRFFHQDKLAFLRSIQASGSVDRLSFSTELLSDRIGEGRLALTAAFAGVTSGATATSGSSGVAKDNVEKFLNQGGDFGVSFEWPIFFWEKPVDMPGFVQVELYPRLVTAVPGLSATVKDASAAFEPAARVHLQAFGFDNTLSPYVDFTGGWAIGMGPGWDQYLGMRHFGFVTMTAGALVSNRFNVGASYLLAGPLRGQNGISISVSALTSN